MASWPPRVALITGAGSGLGNALAQMLAAEGVAIAGIDIKADGLEALAQELQSKGRPVAWETADVTNSGALQKAVETLESRVGPADMLIASAGIGVETPALAFDAETFAAVVRVNLIGVANSVAAVLPGMLRRGCGHLVALSSLASLRGLPLMAGYCASKSGVNALMEAVRVEAASRGIITTTVCPGWIRTPMTANLRFPVPNIMEVDDAARRILRAIRKRQKFVAFPRGVAWQLRLVRWLPTGVGDWMIGRMMRRLMK